MVGSLSHYLHGFIQPRWCRISSINSMFSIFYLEIFPCFLVGQCVVSILVVYYFSRRTSLCCKSNLLGPCFHIVVFLRSSGYLRRSQLMRQLHFWKIPGFHVWMKVIQRRLYDLWNITASPVMCCSIQDVVNRPLNITERRARWMTSSYDRLEHVFKSLLVFFKFTDMGVSKNSGTPKWMVL